MDAPTALLEAVRYSSNPDNALDFFVQVRWPRGVVCPRCGSKAVTFLKNARVWKCKTPHPSQKFSAKVGTVFEDSPIGLDKWLPAIWLAANCKHGVSSYELHRAIGVTQKTAWFMLQRIRLGMHKGFVGKFGSAVEADETFIGAKARNMHLGKPKVKGTGPVAMTPVMGVWQRGEDGKPTQVYVKATKTRRKGELQEVVRSVVNKGAELYTDALRSYDGLEGDYAHRLIDHLESYAKNFWSLLKRALHGTDVNVEPFHLFRYCDEQAFRFNERKNGDRDKGRFILAFRGVVRKSLNTPSSLSRNMVMATVPSRGKAHKAA